MSSEIQEYTIFLSSLEEEKDKHIQHDLAFFLLIDHFH